jgi:hypothetical protein
MKFLCLGYLNMQDFDNAPEDEKGEILKACFAQCAPFRATGKVTMEEGLQHTSDAVTIRPVDGKPTRTPGAFLNTAAQLGAFFIVEAENMEEAVAVASLHPASMFGEKYGFGIEIRPIQ